MNINTLLTLPLCTHTHTLTHTAQQKQHGSWLLANKRTCPTAQSTAQGCGKSAQQDPSYVALGCTTAAGAATTQKSTADHNMAPALPATDVARPGMWRHTRHTTHINHTLCKVPTPVRGRLCSMNVKGCWDSKRSKTTTSALVVQLSGTIPLSGGCRGSGMHCCCACHARARSPTHSTAQHDTHAAHSLAGQQEHNKTPACT